MVIFATPDDNRHLQFSLRGLFWFTTVVAVLCASVACATRLWGDSGNMAWLVIVFLFWPSLAVPIVWTCPDISFPGRMRMYAVIGIGVVLLTWYRTWPPNAALFDMFTATFVAAFLLWVPQGLVVFAAMTYARERGRSRRSLGQGETPHQQSDPPSAGPTPGPPVE